MTEEVHPTWQELRGAADAIVEEFEEEVDFVVAIARGGMPLGVYLSHQLDVPLRFVDASHYRGKERKSIVDVKGMHLDGINNNDDTVLLFDDVVETGKTFGRVKKDIRVFKPVPFDILTASIHVKPDRNLDPDFWVEETDKWIVYPWEPGHGVDES